MPRRHPRIFERTLSTSLGLISFCLEYEFYASALHSHITFALNDAITSLMLMLIFTEREVVS